MFGRLFMKDGFDASMENYLSGVPAGTFEISKRNPPDFIFEKLTAKTSGRGRIEIFSLFPGIELSVHRYNAEEISFHHDEKASVLEINHCRRGRIGWNMRGGASVYLGEGDLCVHSMASCSDSKMVMPLGYYEGISVSADLKKLSSEPTDILKEAGFDAEKLYNKFCAGQKPLGIPSGSQTEAIFSPLYDLPDDLKMPYYRLKAQEILLYLIRFEPSSETGLTQYVSRQTELIKEIRDFLTDNVEKRFTIDEISKKFLINTSTLKSVFKAVYGTPIASYMKEYRLSLSMRLLRATGDSIAEIAEKVGYETQSKFTGAFKEKTGVTPSEYRRFYKKS